MLTGPYQLWEPSHVARARQPSEGGAGSRSGTRCGTPPQALQAGSWRYKTSRGVCILQTAAQLQMSHCWHLSVRLYCLLFALQSVGSGESAVAARRTTSLTSMPLQKQSTA